MSDEKDIYSAISEISPSSVSSDVELLARIINDLINGQVSLAVAQEKVSKSTSLKMLIDQLSGRSIETPKSVLAFGEQSQLGDITIRDVATGITHINIYLAHRSLNERPMSNESEEGKAQKEIPLEPVYMEMIFSEIRKTMNGRGGKIGTKDKYIGSRARWHGIIYRVAIFPKEIELTGFGVIAKIQPSNVIQTTFGISKGTRVLIKGMIEDTIINNEPTYKNMIRRFIGDSSGVVILTECTVDETNFSV